MPRKAKPRNKSRKGALRPRYRLLTVMECQRCGIVRPVEEMFLASVHYRRLNTKGEVYNEFYTRPWHYVCVTCLAKDAVFLEEGVKQVQLHKKRTLDMPENRKARTRTYKKLTS